MINRLIDNKKTKQIRIDIELHRLLKIMASSEKISIKELVERSLGELVDFIPNSLTKKYE